MAKGTIIENHVYGGQVITATDNSTINVTQNNNASVEQIDYIIKNITDNLSKLKKEDAEKIRDVVDMAKEELQKSEPKASRLNNCITLISSMFTIANGIPGLKVNLQKLKDYIQACIK